MGAFTILIVGGGPAGLRAAEIAASAGARVTLADAMPSVGRKFLVAGRGGLNLTRAEHPDRFATRYSGPEMPPDFWPSLIANVNPDALQAWAASLGVETFVASTRRVYPRELKAAPLLRRWVQKLRDLGVTFLMHHRLVAIRPGTPLETEFATATTPAHLHADAVILAMGGGSWPQSGSTGSWVNALTVLGVRVSPLAPANCGWELAWPDSVLASAEGHPLKSIVARANTSEAAGELLITKYGLEGGALYQLGPELRSMPSPELTVDFKPDVPFEKLVSKLVPNPLDLFGEATRLWKLNRAAVAILQSHGPFDSVAALAREVKACKLALQKPRPIAEAISSAGGVAWSELTPELMLARVPGIFVAGEMIDWEAPTGGYLIQGCFATGTLAAQAALQWCAARSVEPESSALGCEF